MQDWRIYSKKADFEAIGERFGIDRVIARIIRNRNLETYEAIDKYINGGLDDLYDPMLMKDMGKACNILNKAIKTGTKIRIIGDYDIDGICSIYILLNGLIKLGADVDYEIPDRITDGYGINENLIKAAYDDGIELILTCDNGIAAVEQVEYAKSLGMTVIVTDHHDIRYVETEGIRKYIVPDADAVINPKQESCNYPFDKLCGAGVAYKLIQAMYVLNDIVVNEMEHFIEFAAIATIGDIVDLQDENRIIVKEGLKRLRKTENYGLNALMTLTGITKTNISAYHIGYIIGPCLNAGGRLDTAKRSLNMLLENNREQAEKYAGDLYELNNERKKLTEIAATIAYKEIEDKYTGDKVLVVFLPDCHESIAGIVAGRIREKFYKPAIVLTKSENMVKGSARSIEGYNIFEKLVECDSLLAKYGGHPMAAGLTLKEENVDILRRELNKKSGLTEKELTETVWIDVPMPIDYITEKIISDVSILEPFGKANPKPVFADKNLNIARIRAMGKNGQYTRMTLANNAGYEIEAVGFFAADELIVAHSEGKRITCTYYPEINEFGGHRKLQICITNYRIE